MAETKTSEQEFEVAFRWAWELAKAGRSVLVDPAPDGIRVIAGGPLLDHARQTSIDGGDRLTALENQVLRLHAAIEEQLRQRDFATERTLQAMGTQDAVFQARMTARLARMEKALASMLALTLGKAAGEVEHG